jgi:hypothetical protein
MIGKAMSEDACTCQTRHRATILPRLRAIELLPGQMFLSAGGSTYERVPELDEHFDGEIRLLGCRRSDGVDDTISPLAFVTLAGEGS